MNPDRDGCGLIWCSPVAPTDGAHARRVTALAGKLILSHGFEPAISLTMITERALACIISLAWDRSVDGEDDRADRCYRDLLTQLGSAGYHSYRLAVPGMHAMASGEPGYQSLLASLKGALDPHSIMAPGRYLTGRNTSPPVTEVTRELREFSAVPHSS
jgi:4-cresol dehydrogenase (hydroxylating)